MPLTNTKNRLAYLQKNVTAKNMVDVGFPVFLAHTPVKTGNAKKHTSKTVSAIVADYPYAGRLDQGSSRQHPEGMVKPAVQAMRDYIKNIVGNK